MLTFGGRTERRGWWVSFFFFVGKNTWAPFPLQVSVSTGTAELWGRVRPRVFFFDATPTAARCTAASGVLHVLHTTASALFRPSLPRRGRLTVVLYDECVVCWRGERALRDRFAMLGLVEHQSRGTVLERQPFSMGTYIYTYFSMKFRKEGRDSSVGSTFIIIPSIFVCFIL